jgi:hypothetical protein
MSGTKDNINEKQLEEALDLNIEEDAITPKIKPKVIYFEDPGNFKVMGNNSNNYSAGSSPDSD